MWLVAAVVVQVVHGAHFLQLLLGRQGRSGNRMDGCHAVVLVVLFLIHHAVIPQQRGRQVFRLVVMLLLLLLLLLTGLEMGAERWMLVIVVVVAVGCRRRVG